MNARIALIVLALLALAGCSRPCDEQMQEFAEKLTDVTARYDDIFDGGHTMTDAEIVVAYQDMKQEASEVKAPTCAGPEVDDLAEKLQRQTVDIFDQTLAFLDYANSPTATLDGLDPYVAAVRGSRSAWDLTLGQLMLALEE